MAGKIGSFPRDKAETFSLTNSLRWNGNILEQAWQGSNGTVNWEPVPATPKIQAEE